MWVLSTSALFFGVPFSLAVMDEAQVMEMEREREMREMGSEILGQGAQGGEGKPAL
jgi:import receptor subunit TOM22